MGVLALEVWQAKAIERKNMSVSLLEVIEAGGYDITTVEDAKWLVSKQAEFEQLISEAEATIEESEMDDEDDDEN